MESYSEASGKALFLTQLDVLDCGRDAFSHARVSLCLSILVTQIRLSTSKVPTWWGPNAVCISTSLSHIDSAPLSSVHFPNVYKLFYFRTHSSVGFPGGSASKESACHAGNLGSVPGLGRSPGEGNGYPLQCSGLENSMGSQRARHN